eukprot:scaffold2284_cov402-Prasinococcus_capsulatus_cf.AAC.8
MTAALHQGDGDLRTTREGGLLDDYDFSLLDANLGVGYDLACRLVCPRGFPGRLTASAALLHPYFLLKL